MEEKQGATVADLMMALSLQARSGRLFFDGRPVFGFELAQDNAVREMDEADPGYNPGGPRMLVADRRRCPIVRLKLIQ